MKTADLVAKREENENFFTITNHNKNNFKQIYLGDLLVVSPNQEIKTAVLEAKREVNEENFLFSNDFSKNNLGHGQ